MTDFRLLVFNAETILAPWKISFSNNKLLKLTLAKSMKNVKVDTCLRKKRTINGRNISGGFFSGLSTDKQPGFVVHGVSNHSLLQNLLEFVEEFITNERVKAFRILCKQSKIYTFSFVTFAGNSQQHFQKTINAKYSYSPSYSKGSETPKTHFFC